MLDMEVELSSRRCETQTKTKIKTCTDKFHQMRYIKKNWPTDVNILDRKDCRMAVQGDPLMWKNLQDEKVRKYKGYPIMIFFMK